MKKTSLLFLVIILTINTANCNSLYENIELGFKLTLIENWRVKETENKIIVYHVNDTNKLYTISWKSTSGGSVDNDSSYKQSKRKFRYSKTKTDYDVRTIVKSNNKLKVDCKLSIKNKILFVKCNLKDSNRTINNEIETMINSISEI